MEYAPPTGREAACGCEPVDMHMCTHTGPSPDACQLFTFEVVPAWSAKEHLGLAGGCGLTVTCQSLPG